MSSSKQREFSLDKEYLEEKARNPSITFSKLEWGKIARKIEKGEAHETLGKALKNGSRWEKAGVSKFKMFNSILKLSRADRVIDYGCGTLRLGVHFIKYLSPNCYMGLDIIPAFIEDGRKLLGKKLLAAKAPKLMLVDKLSLASAEQFSAGVVVSADVAFHIHPDDVRDYFSELSRVTCRSGARLVFDAKISDRPYRYMESGWSWPLEYYQELLSPLLLVAFHFGETYYLDNYCKIGLFEFRRP